MRLIDWENKSMRFVANHSSNIEIIIDYLRWLLSLFKHQQQWKHLLWYPERTVESCSYHFQGLTFCITIFTLFKHKEDCYCLLMLSDEDDAVDLGFAVDLLIADRESWACRHFLETFWENFKIYDNII